LQRPRAVRRLGADAPQLVDEDVARRHPEGLQFARSISVY
jgi:hypothetical protein